MGKCSQKYHTRILWLPNCAGKVERETSPRIWRVFYDKDENYIEVMSDEEGLVQYDFEERSTFKRVPTTSHVKPRGKPANAEVAAGRKLKHLGV